MIEKIKHIFVEETSTELKVLEKELAVAKTIELSDESIEKVFRTMHTIKGSAPMFGFNQLTDIAISVETAFRSLHDGDIVLNDLIIDKTKDVVSLIQEVLNKKNDQLLDLDDKKHALIHFFTNIDRLNVRTND
nr:Hpt domain-containing protein [uncultured Carboxylicivirga sp.]